MITGDSRNSDVYQGLLAEDFRKRIFPIAYVTSFFMFLAAMLNITSAGNSVFFAIDLFVAIAFAMMGVLVKLKKLNPRVVAAILLTAFFVLYVMTLLHDGTVHGILFNYTVVPFVAFFIAGMRIGRLYSFVMLAILVCFLLASSMGALAMAYDTREMGIFFLSLCFGVAGAWLFEHIRERAFYLSYKQSQEYDALMNAIDEVHYRVDMQGIIQRIGSGITKFTDFSPEEVVNHPISMFYAKPEEREAYVQALTSQGKVTNYPITIKGKGGRLVNISMNAALAFNDEGKPEYIEGVFRDVTKEVASENERVAHFNHLQKLSAMEDILSGHDLEASLSHIVQELLDVFQAERAFLTPLCFLDDDTGNSCYQKTFYKSMNNDVGFHPNKLIEHEEVAFYFTSMPKQKKALSKVIRDPSVFSVELMETYAIKSHAMIVLYTNQDTYWLLGIQNIQDGMDTPQQDLLIDISRRIGATLNQLLLQRNLESVAHQAEVASKTKGEFVATISHELRTPLHGVIGLLDLMSSESSKLSLEQQQNLALAQSSAQVLRSLIDDVLDLSKIESGKIVMQKQAFNLQQALSDALIPFVMKAREKDIGLNLEMRNVAEVVEGDVLRLRQVLLNLVGNAIKFTMQGYVRIVVSQDEEMLYINIEDSGIGIDKEKQDIVFSPFEQVHNEQVLGDNLQEKGTGLGTTIAQYFVKMMGGTLTLQSEPSVGSTMKICLPLQQVGKEVVNVDLQMDDLIKVPELTATQEIKAIDDAVKRHGWSVLLAEDDPVGRRIVVKRLQRAGFTVDTAADGNKAFEDYKKGSYDLLLTDIRMPGLSGLQLTEKIRAHEKKQDENRIVIIGLSAYAMEDVKKEALACGMDDFITKPVDMQELIQVLEDRFA